MNPQSALDRSKTRDASAGPERAGHFVPSGGGHKFRHSVSWRSSPYLLAALIVFAFSLFALAILYAVYSYAPVKPAPPGELSGKPSYAGLRTIDPACFEVEGGRAFYECLNPPVQR